MNGEGLLCCMVQMHAHARVHGEVALLGCACLLMQLHAVRAETTMSPEGSCAWCMHVLSADLDRCVAPA